MSQFETDDLPGELSEYSGKVINTAVGWADEIRPQLKQEIGKPISLIDDVHSDSGPSPLDKLEKALEPLGITSPRSIAELALLGMQRSRELEAEKNNG